MNLFYDQDLAYVHHVGFGEFAEQVGNELISIFQQAKISTGLVIDLGCGSGIWAKKLSDCGYSVLGIDISKSMLELAQKVAPKAEFQVSSLYDTELYPCVAVTALGESFNYSFSGIDSLNSLAKLFTRVFRNLQTGGIFAFDIIIKSKESLISHRNFKTGEDWAVLFDVSEKPEKNELIRDIEIFRQKGTNYRRSREIHRVHIFDSEVVQNLLENIGFQVSIAPYYGSYQLSPRRLAYLAYK